MGTQVIRYLALTLLVFMSQAQPLMAAPAPFNVCLDYHCDRTRYVWLDDGKWDQVRQLFTRVNSAGEERDAIAQAIGRLESLVGPLVGTDVDQAENQGPGDVIGQLDCISESKNSDQYLQLLAGEGLLRWHDLQPREVRNPLFFNVHWTAVIRDRASDRRFAVDSWFRANGQPAVIQPLDLWLAGKDYRQ